MLSRALKKQDNNLSSWESGSVSWNAIIVGYVQEGMSLQGSYHILYDTKTFNYFASIKLMKSYCFVLEVETNNWLLCISFDSFFYIYRCYLPGHYIPQLADVLLDYNARSTGFKFNIKGVAIGNPLLKLDRDAQATYEFFWSHGMISDEVGLAIMNKCDFDDYVFASPHNMTDSCNNAISEANDIVGEYINNYDVILDVCYPSIVEQELRLRKVATRISVGVDVCMTYERRFYFNLPEVQKALHANRTKLPYGWSMCSSVLNYSDTDGNIDMLPLLKRIVQNGIPVWVFSGDQDSVVPLLGSRTLIRELAHDLKFDVTVPYGAWFHKGQVGGWATEYGNLLTFATVRGAAHMVPYAQPSRALHLFSSFVRGRRLPNNTRPSIDD
ncbi:serine carboxypeptidase-like 42 [Pistacia vera]|uniref:serine carboxypeptidase-like 42 n=1 Tax=Pistacia vera TaxID=55513 RepID=UPI001263B85B|nr:serine carboxypeptidase-like 42 [Pistacia vera]